MASGPGDSCDRDAPPMTGRLRAYAAEMAFTLHMPVGPQSYPELAHWSMNQKGLLAVQTEDDRLLTFSASGRYWLEEARGPVPAPM